LIFYLVNCVRQEEIEKIEKNENEDKMNMTDNDTHGHTIIMTKMTVRIGKTELCVHVTVLFFCYIKIDV